MSWELYEPQVAAEMQKHNRKSLLVILFTVTLLIVCVATVLA